MDVSLHEDSHDEFCCAGSILFNEVVRIYEQGNNAFIKYLFGQFRNILLFSFPH